MAHASTCPGCASRWPDIRGLLYSPGATVGTQCTDDWHKGADYHPEILVLTVEDRAWLAGMHITIDGKR
jgi:hypothetical protein